jgi:hypothetical protein
MCGALLKVTAHHERFGISGGMGIKPADTQTLSLCLRCHGLRHQMGFDTFWQHIDPKALCIELLGEYIVDWRASGRTKSKANRT